MSDVNYISAEGLEKLKAELEERKTVTRKEIAERIGTAKEQGDLSENFEYQEAKDQQGENERAIVLLEDQINKAVVIEKKEGAECVALGTKFLAELPDGAQKEFEMVGPSETDPIAGKISNESPLGKAFLGACAGDAVTFNAPNGEVSYKVISIS